MNFVQQDDDDLQGCVSMKSYLVCTVRFSCQLADLPVQEEIKMSFFRKGKKTEVSLSKRGDNSHVRNF